MGHSRPSAVSLRDVSHSFRTALSLLGGADVRGIHARKDIGRGLFKIPAGKIASPR